MQNRPHLPASVISAADAPPFWRVGILWNISLSAETTAGQFTMMDQTMPQGTGAPPHVHERYDEGFFIIDGAVEYTVADADGEETTLAEAGAAVWIPRGTRHSFEVKSETSRALNFYTPGGFDESISMLATPADAKTVPPPGSGEEDPRGFQTDPAKEDAYLRRISDLHSQSMP